MAEKMSLKRKRSLKIHPERTGAAKARRSTAPINPPVGKPESCVSDSQPLEESILMPAPDSVEDSYRSEDESGASDDEYVSEFQPPDASELYKEWLSTVERNDVKMMATMLYDRFLEHWHFTKTSRSWRNTGPQRKTISLLEKRILLEGSYECFIVLNDEESQKLALDWVRTQSYVKGKTNMTAQHFRDWVNGSLLPLVSQHHPPVQQQIKVRTASRWLHMLGFQPSKTHKGIYVDGHERADVVDYRKLYLRKLEVLETTHAPLPRCIDDPVSVRQEEDEGKKQFVLIFHDESTFHSNDGQGWLWAEVGKQTYSPKGVRARNNG